MPNSWLEGDGGLHAILSDPPGQASTRHFHPRLRPRPFGAGCQDLLGPTLIRVCPQTSCRKVLVVITLLPM